MLGSFSKTAPCSCCGQTTWLCVPRPLLCVSALWGVFRSGFGHERHETFHGALLAIALPFTSCPSQKPSSLWTRKRLSIESLVLYFSCRPFVKKISFLAKQEAFPVVENIIEVDFGIGKTTHKSEPVKDFYNR